jgi:hypothetical protein
MGHSPWKRNRQGGLRELVASRAAWSAPGGGAPDRTGRRPHAGPVSRSGEAPKDNKEAV